MTKERCLINFNGFPGMKTTVVFLHVIVFCTGLFAGNRAGRVSVPEKMNHAAMGLTENKGQVRGFDGSAHPEVRYVTGSGNMQVFLTQKGLTYQIGKNTYSENGERHPKDRRPASLRETRLKSIETFRMDMELVDANPNARVAAEGRSSSYINYHNRNANDVHQFNKVTYHNVYEGIDWVIYIKGDQLKYDFVLGPGADPGLIRMRFTHHEGLALNNDGSFTAKCRLGSVTEQRPVSFQGPHRVNTRFELRGNVIQFSLDRYDRSEELVIDPGVIWSTFFGEDNVDRIFSCATDAFQNVYVAGTTNSQGLIAPGGHQENFGGDADAFLVKFDMDGILLWSTYYGGSGSDAGLSCVVDAADNVFLCGNTTSGSGMASGGHDNSYGGSTDAFLVKFDNGGLLQWATYYGGTSGDFGTDCAVDASGNIFLAGYTGSSAGISTAGSHQSVYGLNMDAYLVKFSGSGTRLWATYYGGSDEESGFNFEASCATDPSGNVFLAGTTSSNDDISSANGHQFYFGGAYFDCFMVKFNASGVRVWGTYLGGNGMDEAYDCATDKLGNSYLTGSTDSGNNIAFQGFDNSMNQSFNDDAFLVRFSPNGTRQWGTYYGGSGVEIGGFCTTDQQNNVYFGGFTNSLSDIASSGYASTHGAGDDGFIVKMNAGGSRSWALYSGGNQNEMATCAVVDASQDIFLAGYTTSLSEFGVNGHQLTNHGLYDGFLVKYCGGEGPSNPGPVSGSSIVCEGNPTTYSIVPVADALSYVWDLAGTLTGTSTTNTISVVSGWSGGVISVVASGTCGFSSPSIFYVNASQSPQISVAASSSVYCTGTQLQLTAQGALSYSWSAGSMLPSQTVSPHSVTVYTVTGVNAYSCATSLAYTVIPNTVTAFNFTVSGMTASLSISNQACSSFTWDYGNGTGSVLNANPVVTYPNNGTYGICLKCNDLPNGCIRCINITVPGSRIDGVDLVERPASSMVKVFPNPGAGLFTVVAESPSRAVITNALGQTIQRTELFMGENKIDIQAWPDGLYMLDLETDGGRIRVKLVKCD